MPLEWLHLLAIGSVGLGVVSALWLSLDTIRHPPPMAVMRVVWPACALFGSWLVVAFYWRHGRGDARRMPQPAAEATPRQSPHWVQVTKATLHCGSGCALGDLLAESLLGTMPAAAVLFGWHWLFHDRLFASWVLDCLLALLLGLGFQYFTIAPMRGLGLAEGLRAAAKADLASLTAWQVGMLAVMALWQWVLFPSCRGHRASAGTVEFWWAMQTAMLAGFVTSYPVNRWLLRRGLKEPM